MTSSNHSNSGGNGGDTRRARPDNRDPNGAAVQDQVKADAEVLRESVRRVEAAVPANGEAATDPNAAAIQDQVRADHDELQAQARRIEASVPASVRDTPVQRADTATEDATQARRNVDAAHENAEAARAGARRVEQSLANGSKHGDPR